VNTHQIRHTCGSGWKRKKIVQREAEEIFKMPHTTTKVMRLKRPDTRPNEKERRKLSRKIEDVKTIQDIRITKKLKRSEREVQRLPMRNETNVQEKVHRRLSSLCSHASLLASSEFKKEDEKD
jgi:uncharacterized membrane protein YgaE (UPF0421/DUF939 family)